MLLPWLLRQQHCRAPGSAQLTKGADTNDSNPRRRTKRILVRKVHRKNDGRNITTSSGWTGIYISLLYIFIYLFARVTSCSNCCLCYYLFYHCYFKISAIKNIDTSEMRAQHSLFYNGIFHFYFKFNSNLVYVIDKNRIKFLIWSFIYHCVREILI